MSILMDCEIKTSRLALRPIVARDLDQLHQLWTHPDVRKYIWDGVAITREDAAALIEQSADYFARLRYGLWAAVPILEERTRQQTDQNTASHSDADLIIGFCGFWLFRNPPELELIYGFDPAYWGRGFATEAALAIIEYGFDRLSFHSIAGSTDAANSASARVMERAGMKLIKRDVVSGLDTLFYAISRIQFQQHKKAESCYLR
jgi:ribosomal-protein-alanine N-acetyltransferase